MATVTAENTFCFISPFALCLISFYAGMTLLGRCEAQAQARPEKSLPVPQLVDITASTGIHFEHLSSPEQKFIVESMSGGVALIDYDGDGWPDIFFTGAPSVAM